MRFHPTLLGPQFRWSGKLSFLCVLGSCESLLLLLSLLLLPKDCLQAEVLETGGRKMKERSSLVLPSVKESLFFPFSQNKSAALKALPRPWCPLWVLACVEWKPQDSGGKIKTVNTPLAQWYLEISSSPTCLPLFILSSVFTLLFHSLQVSGPHSVGRAGQCLFTSHPEPDPNLFFLLSLSGPLQLFSLVILGIIFYVFVLKQDRQNGKEEREKECVCVWGVKVRRGRKERSPIDFLKHLVSRNIIPSIWQMKWSSHTIMGI